MKTLIGILFTAACFTFKLLPGTALADERCTVEGKTPATFTTALHAGDESLLTMDLATALKEMIDQGCDDDASFDTVIAAFSDPAALDRYRISEPDAWMIESAALGDITLLAILGREEQPRRLITMLQDRAEAGSPEAMTALGILGSMQLSDWQREWDISRERSRYKIRADTIRILYPGVVDRFRIGNWLRWSTHPLERLYPDLPELAEAYLQKASDEGFAPAHVIRLTGEMPEDFSPCVDDRELAQSFSKLPERERIARDIITWAGPRIMESLEPIHEIENRTDLDEPERWGLLALAKLNRNYFGRARTAAARNLALAYAGMRSNCLPGTGEDNLDYGIQNLEEAHKGLRLAIVAPGLLTARDIRGQSLIFAHFIDRWHEEPARHYAAARLILPSSEARRGWTSIRDQLIQQLSRQTIIEAQKLMAKRGFYTAAIDGIPGPRFSQGLTSWYNYCNRSREGRGDDEICIDSTADLYLADWARPFIRAPLQDFLSDPHFARDPFGLNR